jgi:hypothetical protein
MDHHRSRTNHPVPDDSSSYAINDPYYYNNNSHGNIEDTSESQATTHEQFMDEPGANDQDLYDNHHRPTDASTYQDPYQNRHHRDDDDEDDLQQQPRSEYDRNDSPEQYDEPEQASPPPRQHKYSTADLREQGKWKKWCKIFLLFLLMIAFMIGLSMLMNHFFFGDQSDNGPQQFLRDENGTFPKDKQEIDDVCGRTRLAADEGALCKESCVPDYFNCCDPFDEFILYNYTEPNNNSSSSNSTNNGTATLPPKLSSNRYKIPDEKNLTFLEGQDRDVNNTCTLDMDVRGCVAYAKCHALSGQTDPAPSTLSDVCSMERLALDSDSCSELCRKLDCCYSKESDNCLAEKFDLCMDYAPCQNLRSMDQPQGVLEVAPRTLDYDCYWQQQTCTDTCEKARCCSAAGDFSCLQFNFLSCLTYSPCTNVTEIKINVTQQFSHVPQPSIDLVYACDANHANKILEPSDRPCDEICSDAECCWSDNDNCFHLDPLGCLAYEAQCQVLQQ